jgi:glycosyltransferase involved in cell wall biosynthesis
MDHAYDRRPRVAVKFDDKSSRLPSAERIAQALADQARDLGAACAVQPTREWGAFDLDVDLAVHVVAGPTLYHPRPWSVNAALVPEDAAAPPANLGDFDVVGRVSREGEADMVRFDSPPGREGPPDVPASGLLQLLGELPGMAHLEKRAASSRERARSIAEDGPLVSVLLPTHDRLDFLGSAVDSVLDQTYVNWELLVVQDGGPDASGVLEDRPDSRIRFLQLDRNRGKAAALNVALQQARGDHVAYLDDDDVWLPGHLEALMRVLALTPGVRMVHSDGHMLQRRRTAHGWEIDESSRSLPYSRHASLEDILEFNTILGITVAHDKALIREAGPFDERLETLVDFDMWRRMAARTHPCHVSQVTAEFFVWAEDDPRRGQMTGLHGRDLPRYMANRARVLSKPLPETVPERIRLRWRELRRAVRYEFLLQRGLHFLRREKRPARALVSLERARGFCPANADSRRILAIAFLEAGAGEACLEFLQQNLADAVNRRPADYLYASLAHLQRGQAVRALDLLDGLEREFSLSGEERELARRYRSLARPERMRERE